MGYRQTGWQPDSNGHPSVLARYDAPRLVLSEPQEGESSPTASWAVWPRQRRRAVAKSEVELERFARQITSAMPSGYGVDPRLMGRKLAGLARVKCSIRSAHRPHHTDPLASFLRRKVS